jgi:rRNA maturation protein Nop10
LEPETTELVLEVPKHGEAASIAIPAPVSLDDKFNNDLMWRYAALRRSIRETALVFNCTEEELAAQVLKNFKVTWEQLSERAWLECQFEIESNICARAKGNDPRFVLLLDKMQRLSGFASFGNEAVRLPASVQRDLRSMSTEELMKRRDDLSRVIDRPRTFDRVGQINPTLELRATIEGEGTVIPVQPPVPTESMIVLGEVIKSARAVEEVVEAVKVIPESVKPTPQGPVIARPEAGLLCL